MSEHLYSIAVRPGSESEKEFISYFKTNKISFSKSRKYKIATNDGIHKMRLLIIKMDEDHFMMFSDLFDLYHVIKCNRLVNKVSNTCD